MSVQFDYKENSKQENESKNDDKNFEHGIHCDSYFLTKRETILIELIMNHFLSPHQDENIVETYYCSSTPQLGVAFSFAEGNSKNGVLCCPESVFLATTREAITAITFVRYV